MEISQAKHNRLALLENRGRRILGQLERCQAVERVFPWARLGVFLAGAALTITAFTIWPVWAGWLALSAFLLGFAWVAARHRRVLDRIEDYATLARLNRQEQARAALEWAEIPAPPVFGLQKEHPFALDLNITGERSLHHLLDTTSSMGGSQRLLDWLTVLVPDVAQVQRRQELVGELLTRPAFRTRLALAGAQSSQWDGAKLLRWLESSRQAGSLKPYLVVLAGLALINAALLVGWLAFSMPPYWLISLALFWGVQGLKYREISEVFGEATGLARTLSQFREVLDELETYPYPRGSALAGLTAPFWQAGGLPSRALRRLTMIISGASLRSNAILGLLLNSILPWDMFFAYQLELLKNALAGLLPRWLDAWYELEALLALTNFAALNSDAVFARVVEQQPGAPIFDGEQVGHPLIHETARIANDFTIQTLGQIFVITGSNMSGKSTFLRTLGVNLALAYAGSVVCAARFEAAPFRLFTAINLSDSLSDGISYFYAEVRRLRALLDALEQAGQLPLFFLIDEIFRGTNNRERQIGGLAYTRALTGKNGCGLISTHDLELAHLADENPAIRNLHFREEVRDGRMVFDYLLRAGPSPTTNALQIMALEGLPTG